MSAARSRAKVGFQRTSDVNKTSSSTFENADARRGLGGKVGWDELMGWWGFGWQKLYLHRQVHHRQWNRMNKIHLHCSQPNLSNDVHVFSKRFRQQKWNRNTFRPDRLRKKKLETFSLVWPINSKLQKCMFQKIEYYQNPSTNQTCRLKQSSRWCQNHPLSHFLDTKILTTLSNTRIF